jgi:hypothetical protein
MSGDVSDELLCSFIDGELAPEERAEILARMQADAGLRDRVCALLTAREMVRLAYAQVPAGRADRRARGTAWRVSRQAAVAVLLLGVGLAGGWVLQGSGGARTADAGIARLLPAGVQPVHLVRGAAPAGVLLHIDSAEPARLGELADYVQGILDGAERRGVTVEVEVLANYRGLDVLRSDLAAGEGRIARLALRSPRVSLVACGQTIARLRREGQPVTLLPGVREAPSAVGEIVDRLQAGWAYIKV